MNCVECKELLVAYAEDLLEESQKQVIESHLNTCPPCRAELTQVISLRDRLAANGKALAQSDLEDKVLHRIVQERSSRLKKISKSSKQIQLWRIIMKSRIAKLAAAAVVIIVTLIGIDYFSGSVDPTSVAWGKMIENMKQLPWMHIIMESERDNGKQRFEVWVSFESQVGASKRSSGEATYLDGQMQVSYIYNPGEQAITVAYVDANEITKGATSVWNFWETWLKQVAEFSTESTTAIGEYNGRKARIYKFKASKNKMSYESMITVDISRNLPVFGHQKSFDSNGNLIKAKDLYFDYPEEGPASIYDVGAPRNVRIIDNLSK